MFSCFFLSWSLLCFVFLRFQKMLTTIWSKFLQVRMRRSSVQSLDCSQYCVMLNSIFICFVGIHFVSLSRLTTTSEAVLGEIDCNILCLEHPAKQQQNSHLFFVETFSWWSSTLCVFVLRNFPTLIYLECFTIIWSSLICSTRGCFGLFFMFHQVLRKRSEKKNDNKKTKSEKMPKM